MAQVQKYLLEVNPDESITGRIVSGLFELTVVTTEIILKANVRISDGVTDTIKVEYAPLYGWRPARNAIYEAAKGFAVVKGLHGIKMAEGLGVAPQSVMAWAADAHEAVEVMFGLKHW